MKNTQDIMNEGDSTDRLMDVMSFLVWSADADKTYGGVDAKVALEGFRHIIGWDQARFASLCDVFRA